MDVLTLTAVEIQRLLAHKAINIVNLTTLYLEQIEKHNHAGLKLNAIITTAPRESILARARHLDEEREKGTVRGPFHGVPILVKVRINRNMTTLGFCNFR